MRIWNSAWTCWRFLKAMGADSADLLRIFLLQTLGLGLAGGLLGVAAGVAVMAALPAAFGKLLPVHVDSSVSLAVRAGGTGNGPADDSAVLPAAAAGRARGAAGAGAAPDGGAGAVWNCGLDCAMVGAPTANRHCGGGDCGAWRHRMGAFRFAKSRRAGLPVLFTLALVVLLVLGSRRSGRPALRCSIA